MDRSPMLTTVKIGADMPKSKMWIIYALVGTLFYGGFNYTIGVYNTNPVVGTSLTSIISGILMILFDVGYRVIKKWKKENEVPEG